MKKLMKKLIAGIVAMTMVMAMGVTVFAADPANVTPNGNGTITITNAVKGETYKVYRLFNAMANSTTNAIVYGQAPANDLGDYFKLDDEGYVVAKDTLTPEVLASDEFKTWAKAHGTPVDSKTANTNGNLTFNNISYGYYYVTSSQGATISVDSLNPDATITDKNSSKPTVPTDAKKIVLADGTTVDHTSAAVGEDVNFQIKFDARNYDGDTLIRTYTITDTPKNLSINIDSVKIQVIENPGTDDAKTNDITLTTGINANGLSITIPWVDDVNAEKPASMYANKSQIVITYTATVLSTAENGEASNKATITWTGKEKPEEPIVPKVYTYSFTLQKLDGKDKTTQLNGAEFKLYSGTTEIKVVAVDASGNVIKDVTADNAESVDHYRVASTDESSYATTIVAGNVTIKGLKEGTAYNLEETKAPKGYNKLTEKTEKFPVNADTSKDGVDEKVYNNQGTVLPSTGGMGTTIFYALGAALAIGAGVILVTRKRLSK